MQLLDRYLSILSPDEYTRYKKYYFEANRHQYLVSRALLRSVLSIYYNHIAPETWIFSRDFYGKPSIANRNVDRLLQFNLSYTSGMVVLAVTSGCSIGVDIEAIKEDANVLSLAERYFRQSEVNLIKSSINVQQYERFYELWTLKEAYIKAKGKGLSIPLDSFSFSFSRNNDVAIEFDRSVEDDPSLWRLWQLMPGKAYRVAVALREVDKSRSYKLISNQIIPFGAYSAIDYPVFRTGGAMTTEQNANLLCFENTDKSRLYPQEKMPQPDCNTMV